jgi:hypothetical protein
MPKKWKKTGVADTKNTVLVKQSSHASTGQGGNAFAINASDVGVIRTDVAPSSGR